MAWSNPDSLAIDIYSHGTSCNDSELKILGVVRKPFADAFIGNPFFSKESLVFETWQPFSALPVTRPGSRCGVWFSDPARLSGESVHFRLGMS